jgi:hypothetical protein
MKPIIRKTNIAIILRTLQLLKKRMKSNSNRKEGEWSKHAIKYESVIKPKDSDSRMRDKSDVCVTMAPKTICNIGIIKITIMLTIAVSLLTLI